MIDLARDDGVAMVVALMAVLLMTAIGAALILTSMSETMIAAHFRDNLEARYAAAAIVDREMDDLAAASDWALVAGGAVASSWVDGTPSGVRALRDGTAIDLVQVVNLANCQKPTACSTADLDAVTPDRPWGVNNPRWKPYAYGFVRDLFDPAATNASPQYVLLLASATVGSPGWDVLALRSEAFGPRGAHAVVEATAGRPASTAGVRLLSWREVR